MCPRIMGCENNLRVSMTADGEPKVGYPPPPLVFLMLNDTNEMMNRWRKEVKRSVKAK